MSGSVLRPDSPIRRSSDPPSRTGTARRRRLPMNQKMISRIAGGAIATAALLGLGGHAVQGAEESTGIAQTEKKIDDATGVTTIDDETGVTKAEAGLGLG